MMVAHRASLRALSRAAWAAGTLACRLAGGDTTCTSVLSGRAVGILIHHLIFVGLGQIRIGGIAMIGIAHFFFEKKYRRSVYSIPSCFPKNYRKYRQSKKSTRYTEIPN